MSENANFAIQLKGIEKTFPSGVHALQDINLQIQESDFVSLLGPSGCGKSTLLRIIASLEKPSRGEVHLHQSSAPKSRADISFVFQDPTLLPWRNILRNVALPLEIMGMDEKARHLKAREALNLVGLTEFSAAYPNQLSGGMKMRASIARALATEPKLLLLDEPFAALDEITRMKLDLELRDIWKRIGVTIVFVTHSISEALFLSNRSIILSARPGRIIHDSQSTLPAERTREIRSSNIFNQEVHKLSQIMEGTR